MPGKIYKDHLKGTTKVVPFFAAFFYIVGFGNVCSHDTELTTQWSIDYRLPEHELSAHTVGNSLFILYNAKNALFFPQDSVRI